MANHVEEKIQCDAGESIDVVQRQERSFIVMTVSLPDAHTRIMIGTRHAKALLEILRRCVGED